MRQTRQKDDTGKSPAMFFARKAQEITDFVHTSPVFKGWPVPLIYQYVFFHVVDRTVFTVREHSKITAALFAWGASATDIQKRATAKLPHFEWRRSRDGEDAIFLAEVIGRREVLPRLARQVEQRWNWRTKRVFTYRGDLLVEFQPALIERMLGLKGANGQG